MKSRSRSASLARRGGCISACITLGLPAATPCRAQDSPSFKRLPSSTTAMQISGDGLWVVGYRGITLMEAVLWHVPTGATTILPVAGPVDAQAFAVNHDGSVIVGLLDGRGCIWKNGEPAALLAPLPAGYYWARPTVVNADGRVVAGRLDGDPGSVAFRWTDPAFGGAGFEVIGDLPGGPVSAQVNGISPDGRVICGKSLVADDGGEAFRWTDPATGGAGLESLGDLPGGRISSAAHATSADGSVIVGQGAIAPAGFAEAFIWTDPVLGGSGMAGLGSGSNTAVSVNLQGTIISGWNSAVHDPGSTVFVWTAAKGRIDLYQWLLDQGTPGLENWELKTTADASDDGLVILGSGYQDGLGRHWVVNLAGALCPADFTRDGLTDFADYLEFLNRYDALDPTADLNRDGLVDFPDYLEFLNQYDAGC